VILKDVSISSEIDDIQQAIVSSMSLDQNSAKGDPFLISDFANYIGKTVELQRNSDGKYFRGILESVKVDIEPFTKLKLQGVSYLIKLKEYDEDFLIVAEGIEYNTNNPQKYYFAIDNKIIWRIVF
jgi:hypothetical protein